METEIYFMCVDKINVNSWNPLLIMITIFVFEQHFETLIL